MSDYDFQCTLCGEQFDGGVQHEKPDNCPACGAPEKYIVDAEAAEEHEAENRAINKHDEYLED